jgi:hypothetical protein
VKLLKKVNVLTLVLFLVALASLGAKLKTGYGFYEGR